MAAKTRRSGIGIRRRAQACREQTPTATTTATTVMYRALRNKLQYCIAYLANGAARPVLTAPSDACYERRLPGGRSSAQVMRTRRPRGVGGGGACMCPQGPSARPGPELSG